MSSHFMKFVLFELYLRFLGLQAQHLCLHTTPSLFISFNARSLKMRLESGWALYRLLASCHFFPQSGLVLSSLPVCLTRSWCPLG